MLPNITRGYSFKALGQYLTHDKRDELAAGETATLETAERVGFIKLCNLDDGEARTVDEAVKVMALTVRDADRIKQAAGVRGNGKKAEAAPVYHLSLSWTKGEQVDEAAMMQAVREALQAAGIGLDKGYQTVIVEHTDTEHQHVHAMVNLAHPVTGKQANPHRDQPKLQAWADEYDRKRGHVFCEDRADKYAEIDRKKAASQTRAAFTEAAKGGPAQPRRGPGHDAKPDAFNRDRDRPRQQGRGEGQPHHQHQARQSRNRTARADAYRISAELRARSHATRSRQQAGDQQRQAELRQHRTERQAGRSAIYDKYAAALDAIYNPQKGSGGERDFSAARSVRAVLAERQQQFDLNERTGLGRVRNALKLAEGLSLFRAVRLALNAAERTRQFDREQRGFIKASAPRQERQTQRPHTPDHKHRQAAHVKAMRAAELAQHDRDSQAQAAAMQARHAFQQQGAAASMQAYRAAAKAAWAQHERDFPRPQQQAGQARPDVQQDNERPSGEQAAEAWQPGQTADTFTAPALDPGKIIEALTAQQSTFSRADLTRHVNKAGAAPQQARDAIDAVMRSPDLMQLGKDAQGRDRFSSKGLQDIERDMVADAATLAAKASHAVAERHQNAGLNATGLRLDPEQLAAFRHVTGSSGLAAVVGYAGSGKSTMLGAARAAWEAQGYRVRGAALAGVAADSLQGGAGIDSATLHSRLFQWDQGRDLLTANDVLVVDEAGMIGSRLMGRILAHARAAGAKVVLVGDPEQLQAIDAGAAFRAVTERTEPATMTNIRRQREGWQQQATRDLAAGRAGAALGNYEQAGMVHGHASTADAKTAIVAGWDQARKAQPDETHIILAYKRDDVRDLNQLARDRRQAAGELGPDHVMQTGQGKRSFATGDRLYFLKNDRTLGVRNGSLGSIETIEGDRMTVRLDSGAQVAFSLAAYASVDHGYAATIHKSQGVTVDRAHVLATKLLDKHAAYVAMTRHRARVDVHWSGDEFCNRAALSRAFGRRRAKDTGLDYDQAEAAPEAKPDRFGRRRGATRKPRQPREARGEQGRGDQGKGDQAGGGAAQGPPTDRAAGHENSPVDATNDLDPMEIPEQAEALHGPNLGERERGRDHPLEHTDTGQSEDLRQGVAAPAVPPKSPETSADERDIAIAALWKRGRERQQQDKANDRDGGRELDF